MRVLKKSKLNIYFIVNVISLSQINLLIGKDLLFYNKLKNCKLFHENYRVTQYFNCYEYSHIIRLCQKEKKCSIYAASDHDDQMCSLQDIPARHRCVNCN